VDALPASLPGVVADHDLIACALLAGITSSGLVALGDLQPTAPRDLLRWRGHPDLEDAIPESRRGSIDDRSLGQRDLPEEASGGPLNPVDVAMFFGVLLLSHS
jgi:hypothetical protein